MENIPSIILYFCHSSFHWPVNLKPVCQVPRDSHNLWWWDALHDSKRRVKKRRKKKNTRVYTFRTSQWNYHKHRGSRESTRLEASSPVFRKQTYTAASFSLKSSLPRRKVQWFSFSILVKLMRVFESTETEYILCTSCGLHGSTWLYALSTWRQSHTCRTVAAFGVRGTSSFSFSI